MEVGILKLFFREEQSAFFGCEDNKGTVCQCLLGMDMSGVVPLQARGMRQPVVPTCRANLSDNYEMLAKCQFKLQSEATL